MVIQKKLVPPDGGWAWVIMCAYAINNLVYYPLLQNFGLVVRDAFAKIGISATRASVILTTNAAFGMIMGLIIGPLLKKFGFRKIALTGAVFLSIGYLSVALATEFIHFLITYGLITSIGVGIGMNAYPLAMNTYFRKKRNKATGYAFTITGIGSILMPQLISLLLSTYGFRGTMIIIGGICFHTFIAALLLQPVKWHMKEIIEGNDVQKQSEATKEDDVVLLELNDDKQNRRSTINSNLSIDHDAETKSIYGLDAVPDYFDRFIPSDSVNRRRSTSTCEYKPIKKEKWTSTPSFDVALKVIGERKDPELLEATKIEKTEDLTEVSTKSKCFKRFINFFDLALLKDPIYLNIMIGMSAAVFAEINFSLLTPFILADIGLDTQQSATFLSILSVVDLMFRFVSPFIGDYFKKSPRIMYMISLIMLITTRFSLVMVSSHEALIAVAVGLGIAKGVRTVYMTLVIPSYVPIERLASAAALQLVVNGFFILAGGPILGVIRDLTGSYSKCVLVMNVLTLYTVIMWTMEMVYMKIRQH